MTWLELTRRFALEHGVAETWLEALEALRSPNPRGGPPPPPEREWVGDFASLERAELGVPSLDEVDREQAAMFLRRVRTVHERLVGLGGPEGRVLAVGLKVRLAGMARCPGPQAVRVRALADFYYSQAAQLVSQRSCRIRPLSAVLEDLSWRTVGEGAEHGVLEGEGPRGPIHVNLLRLEPRRFEMQVVDLRGSDGDLARVARERGAVAATSGGFFLYSEPDITEPSRQGDPVGLFVADGVVRGPPWLPRGALVSTAGQVAIGVVRTGSAAYTRATGDVGPDVPSTAFVGRSVREQGRKLAVPLNGAVVEGEHARLSALDLLLNGQPVVLDAGIAGGPMLLRDGVPCMDLRAEGFWGTAPPVTFSQDETGDRNLLPRLAAGLDAEGRLVMAAVDGRNFEHALGMTLGDVTALMAALGCHTAVNLDGGSSKRMVVGGRTVDLASTEVRADAGATAVRPVRTGILWVPSSR